MAGVWSASVYYQGLLEEGDVNEAITALEAIGDSEGVVSHGTPQERAIAFTAGYAGITDLTGPGDPSTCIQTYWRQS